MSPPADAHPIHTSLAEADYNRTTGKLEIALRVFADDFEARLSVHAGRKISLEKTPAAEFDEVTRAYLAERFTVKSREGTLAAHTWVGRELKEAANELWLFFEIPLPGGIEGAVIRHGVLSEHFSDQLNSVRVRDGGRKATLIFLPSHREKTVRFPP